MAIAAAIKAATFLGVSLGRLRRRPSREVLRGGSIKMNEAPKANHVVEASGPRTKTIATPPMRNRAPANRLAVNLITPGAYRMEGS